MPCTIDPLLLEILVCPETKQPVVPAEEALLQKLEAARSAGNLRNRAGELVKEPFQGGLVRQDRAYLYPIMDEIPVMLIEQGIPLAGFL